jgi:GNAT superfamily N-acetyltransferase
MSVEIIEEDVTTLGEYARIPIAFEVSRVLEVTAQGNGSGIFILSERELNTPYVKDYDAFEGEGPTQWAGRFDVSHWGLLAARVEGKRVGGAAVAFNTPGLDMLEGREDLAVLWDIRVSPVARGQGVGSALFHAAELWAKARGCKQLKVETQNINVPACKFYARQGCVLGAVNQFAYPEYPDEIQMFWYKNLSHSCSDPSLSGDGDR